MEYSPMKLTGKPTYAPCLVNGKNCKTWTRHESRLFLIDCETDGLWAGKETHSVCFYFQVQPMFFSGNYCSSQALVCFQWFCCNVMSETHDKHCVLILIHVSMAKDNFLWGGIRRYHLKWVAAHLLRPRAPYAEMRHLRGMRQCFGGAYTTQPATWFLKKTCLSQLKKRSQAPSPGSLTKGRFWQPAMLLDVTSGMSHTFHIINTSWKLDAREVKTELLSDVRRPLGPLDLPTAPSIHHDDPPSTPPSRCRHKIRVPIKQDFW